MAADDHLSSPKYGKTTASTGAVSPNSSKKPKERVPVRSELAEINQYLMCPLCSGYLIDATAIIECQHTFCKSCILKYLETNSYCPICDVQLNKAKPHLSLRSDVNVQRLVYKLIPGLMVSEMRRRRDFAVTKCGTEGLEAAESVSDGMALEVEAATDLSTILSLEDVVSLSIEYFRSEEEEAAGIKQPGIMHQKQDQQQTATTAIQGLQDIKTTVGKSKEANDRRYLQCPAAVSVGLLKKFIRMKYGLSDDYRVDLLYNGNRDNILENELTLLDVAFIFKWNKDEPIRFHYRIFDRSVKSSGSRSGTKRSAPSSMMDEPPDDDAASGPPNRSSMPSASPSSKFPRFSSNSTSTNSSTSNTGNSSSRTTSKSTLASTSAFDFSDGNDEEDDTETFNQGMCGRMKKRKSRGFHRKDSNSNVDRSSKINSHSPKRSPTRFRSHPSRSQSSDDKTKPGKVDKVSSNSNLSKRSMSTNTGSGNNNRGRSNSVEIPGNGSKTGEGESTTNPLKKGISSSTEGSKNSESLSPNSRLRSSQNPINGSLKFSISAEESGKGKEGSESKHQPLKFSLASVLSKSPERKHHKHKHHKIKHKEKKSLKVAQNSSNQSQVNQSMSQTHSYGSKSLGKDFKGVTAKGSHSSEVGVGSTKGIDLVGSKGNAYSVQQTPNSVKIPSSPHLGNISKSISVSIGVNVGVNGPSGNNTTSNASATQNTPYKSTHQQQQFGGGKNLPPSSKLPRNTGIEIQTTSTPMQQQQGILSSSGSGVSSSSNHQSTSRSHPLLPDSVHVPKSVTLIPVNPNAMNGGPGSVPSRVNPTEKSGSGTSNRLNSHTFTHPITNKSLHQITVTEVPPPPKSGSTSPANNSGGSGCGNIGNSNVGHGSTANGPNPIEKVIANATNKPQFNGPGSMEITKIYCGAKENPAKKLKERKGLDISISVPGMNVNNSIKDKGKATPKLEETLRQKIAINNPATTVTSMNTKIKPSSQPSASTLLSAKMPPGITIGPAGINKNCLTTSNNQNTNVVANANNTMKGLGFNLPPHITAHPQLPPGGLRNVHNNTTKVNDKQSVPRPSVKDNASSGGKNINKGQGSTSSLESMPNGKTLVGNKGFQSRKQLGEAFATAMLDMAARSMVKSPSPPKNMQGTKDKGQIISSPFTTNQTSHGKGPNSVKCDKRALDMTSSSRKNSRDSPEPKRLRVTESSTGSKSTSSTSEIPLDLSGRSSRPSSATSSNSSSSSPILPSVQTSCSLPSLEKSKISDSYLSSITNPIKASPPPVPKVSPTPTTTSHSLPKSTSSKVNLDLCKNSLMKPSTSAGTQTANPTILSIAQSLAQKQQQQQNLHNQIMQLHGLHGMHTNQSQSNQLKSGGLSSSLKNPGSGGNNGNMNLNSPSMGLSSLSPPMIPMPNPSPPGPGFDPLRNLLTLSDAAVRHGKLHPMNNLMAGLCPPPPPPNHTHGLSLSSCSPSSVSAGGLFSHLPPHLTNSLGAKSPTGILDPGSHAHIFGNLVALSAAHNERLAAAAGMNHFGGSLSPPLSLANSYYSPTRPPSNNPLGSLRIPGVTPKSSSPNNSNKKGSTPPLSFSHPPTVSAPHSPNNSSTKSPSNSNPPALGSTKSPIHSSSTGLNSKSSDSILHKNIKVNGSLSNPLPLLPPGIHNPLMPSNRSLSSSSSSFGITSYNKTPSIGIGSASGSSNLKSSQSTDKKGIPNSMKISNFLPNKPKDGTLTDSNVEATITSGSNVGGTSLTKFLNSIPPLIVSQSQPNLSVSSPPKDSSRLLNTSPKASTAQQSIPIFSQMHSNTLPAKDSKLVSGSGSSSLANSIKKEPQTVISSQLLSPIGSSNTDPLSCRAKSSSQAAENKVGSEKITVKPNSCEIKSEERGLTGNKVGSESGSGRTIVGVGILGLSGLSPPSMATVSSSSTSGRTTQPQNQAVRHIPNPSLLFNRQNCNIISSSQSTSSTPSLTSTTTGATTMRVKEDNTSTSSCNPFNRKSPLKIDEHSLQVPSLPFPGVSVPVQVKVDNDSVSIPILVEQAPKPKADISDPPPTTTSLLANGKTQIGITMGIKDRKTSQTNVMHLQVEEVTKLSQDFATNSNKQQQSQPASCTAVENVPAVDTVKVSLIAKLHPVVGGIMQVIEKEDNNAEDGDVDIDVGTEISRPTSPHDDELMGKTEEAQEQKCSSSIPSQVEITEQANASVKEEVISPLEGPGAIEKEALATENESVFIIKKELDVPVKNEEGLKIQAVEEDVKMEENIDPVKDNFDAVLLNEDSASMETDTGYEAPNANIDPQDPGMDIVFEEKVLSEEETGKELAEAQIDADARGVDEAMEVHTDIFMAEPMVKKEDVHEIWKTEQVAEIPKESSQLIQEAQMEVVEAEDTLNPVDRINNENSIQGIVDTPMESVDNVEEETQNREIPMDTMDESSFVISDIQQSIEKQISSPVPNIIIMDEPDDSSDLNIVEKFDEDTQSKTSLEIVEDQISTTSDTADIPQEVATNTNDPLISSKIEPQLLQLLQENEDTNEKMGLPVLSSEIIPQSIPSLVRALIPVTEITQSSLQVPQDIVVLKTMQMPLNQSPAIESISLDSELPSQIPTIVVDSSLSLTILSTTEKNVDSKETEKEIIRPPIPSLTPSTSDNSSSHDEALNQSKEELEKLKEEVEIISPPVEVPANIFEEDEKSQNIIEDSNLQPVSQILSKEVETVAIALTEPETEDHCMDDFISPEKEIQTPAETTTSNATTTPNTPTTITSSVGGGGLHDPLYSKLELIEESLSAAPESVQQPEKEVVKAEMPALISATATITTTSKSIRELSPGSKNGLEIEVEVLKSSADSTKIALDSPSSLLNPSSGMETLEKVAAGLFASANNNNNTSLTTMSPPTCDMTITTTNANA